MKKLPLRFRVWDRTTRIFHWLNAISVLALAVVGYLIMNTKLLGIESDGKILLKTIHVYIGYIFFFNLVWRLVWAFVGGYYSRWKQILPVGRGYIKSLKTYLQNSRTEQYQSYLGHNPVGRLIVSLFLFLLLSQAVTGLVLAGTDLYMPPFGYYFSEWVTEGDDQRIQALKPGDRSQTIESAYQEMRTFRKPFITIHEIGFYILLFLIVLHITGVFVTEIREKNGLVSAMITGEKIMDGEPLDKQK